MNTKELFAIGLLLLLSFSCKEGSKTTEIPGENNAELVGPESDTTDPNEDWQLIVNAQLDSLYPLYTKDAYKVGDKGEIVMGDLRIMDLYKQKGLVINNISSTDRITAVLDSTIIYEVGKFSTPERVTYHHLIIWRKQGEQIKRELELIAEGIPDTPVPVELEERRKKWMSLCNAHKVTDLVNELYTENALYYNHKPMVVGREAVIKEYQYMDDPNYQLGLEPLTVDAVNDSLVFEIGRCSGSYRGNYALVWKKGDDGIWRILLDSNI